MIYDDRADKAESLNRCRNLAYLFLGMSSCISGRGPEGVGWHHFFERGKVCPCFPGGVGAGVLQYAFLGFVCHPAFSTAEHHDGEAATQNPRHYSRKFLTSG